MVLSVWQFNLFSVQLVVVHLFYLYICRFEDKTLANNASTRETWHDL